MTHSMGFLIPFKIGRGIIRLREIIHRVMLMSQILLFGLEWRKIKLKTTWTIACLYFSMCMVFTNGYV